MKPEIIVEWVFNDQQHPEQLATALREACPGFSVDVVVGTACRVLVAGTDPMASSDYLEVLDRLVAAFQQVFGGSYYAA